MALPDIKDFLVAYNYSYNAASDWPCIFLQPGCFCLAYVLRWHNASPNINNYAVPVIARYLMQA